MERLPLDMLTHIIRLSKVSLAFLVCRKWRDLYKSIHEEFKYFPSSVLLHMSTVSWYVTTYTSTITELDRDKIFNYACRYAPIPVIDYLASNGYINWTIKDSAIGARKHGDSYYLRGTSKLKTAIHFAHDSCLESLDLNKIKWFFSFVRNSKYEDGYVYEKDILVRIDISSVIRDDNISILEYLNSIDYQFTQRHFHTASRYDCLETFKYMKNKSTERIEVVSLIMKSAESNGDKIPRYVMEELGLEPDFDEDEDRDFIFETAVEHNNIALIKYLYSREIRSDRLDLFAAQYRRIEILKWMNENNIDIPKDRIIKEMKRRKQRKIDKLKNNSLNNSQSRIKKLEGDIVMFDLCINYVESL